MEEKNTTQKKEQTPDKKIVKPFQIVEAYKTLRTNLLFTLATAERKTVIVSSAEPHAGKSTTAANLAIVMAQTNFKVLLIDADMRKPSLDRIFHVGRSEGLSKVISTQTAFEDAVVKQVAPNLDLLPAGPIPPNPQELLCSDEMRKLLEKAEKRYHYIFMDAPPINLVSDALMPMAWCAGMLLVVREGQTGRDDIRAAVESVERIEGRILGTVLTDVKSRRGLRGDRYYKSAEYEYGN